MHWLRTCKAFWCALKKLWLNSVLARWYLKSNISENSNDFSKHGLKWKLITLPSFFFFKFLNISEKMYWFNITFFNSVSCQHVCSISTNEVSNEILWYPLSILVKKKLKRLKKLNDDENEKMAIFYENKTPKSFQLAKNLFKKNLGS